MYKWQPRELFVHIYETQSQNKIYKFYIVKWIRWFVLHTTREALEASRETEPLPLSDLPSARGSWVCIPRLRLLPEVAEFLLVFRMEHRFVRLGNAQPCELLVEALVSPVQEVDFGVGEVRVRLLVLSPVRTPQVPVQCRSSCAREFAVEHEDVPLSRILRWDVLLVQQLKALIFGVDVYSTAYVATIEFVGIPAVNDAVGWDTVPVVTEVFRI